MSRIQRSLLLPLPLTGRRARRGGHSQMGQEHVGPSCDSTVSATRSVCLLKSLAAGLHQLTPPGTEAGGQEDPKVHHRASKPCAAQAAEGAHCWFGEGICHRSLHPPQQPPTG